MTPWSEEWRLDRLQLLYDEWADCERCKLCNGRQNIVFGEGSIETDLMFIGEGPGEEEDKCGDPFVGGSGQLLEDLFDRVGINRSEVFLTNLVMCRPPSNRDPTKLESDSCAPRLYEQIRIVNPLLIIPIGKVAMKVLMKGDWKSILDNQHGHGQLGKLKIPAVQHVEDIVYDAMPIIHPAFILRADSIDPSTGTWPEDGYCHQTIQDLTSALDWVQFLKKQYRKTRDAFHGHPALKVQ